MEKFPSHDFHRIVGKFNEDTGDNVTPPPPQLLQDAAHLAEKFLNYLKFICRWEKIWIFYMWCDSVKVERLHLNQEVRGLTPIEKIFISSLDFSEISKERWVKCFWKFLKGGGLNRIGKFTGQGTCSHVHSEAFLGNMHCFWNSVLTPCWF
jgi:hypothetical protein